MCLMQTRSVRPSMLALSRQHGVCVCVACTCTLVDSTSSTLLLKHANCTTHLLTHSCLPRHTHAAINASTIVHNDCTETTTQTCGDSVVNRVCHIGRHEVVGAAAASWVHKIENSAVHAPGKYLRICCITNVRACCSTSVRVIWLVHSCNIRLP